jgi:hypothetical protein
MGKACCNHDGCTKHAQGRGGFCIRHGGIVKRCSHDGCEKQAQKGGVCIIHGGIVKRCSHKGCTSFVQKKGLCHRHGENNIHVAISQRAEGVGGENDAGGKEASQVSDDDNGDDEEDDSAAMVVVGDQTCSFQTKVQKLRDEVNEKEKTLQEAHTKERIVRLIIAKEYAGASEIYNKACDSNVFKGFPPASWAEEVATYARDHIREDNEVEIYFPHLPRRPVKSVNVLMLDIEKCEAEVVEAKSEYEAIMKG